SERAEKSSVFLSIFYDAYPCSVLQAWLVRCSSSVGSGSVPFFSIHDVRIDRRSSCNMASLEERSMGNDRLMPEIPNNNRKS
ncbi:hypothetical protein, partial [Pseudomonas syringae group genomosp. 7]|uniref:hypothetical protein n=1 Tax=Pseudomonas syringae group genomosp. 7 TaxID=251699 RepID=UPI00376FF0EB